MVIQKVSTKELNGLVNSDAYKVGETHKCYRVNDLLYKINRVYLHDLASHYFFNKQYVDFNQICYLADKQHEIKETSLPMGVLVHQGMAFGVIYKMHQDYLDFTSLPQESSDLVLNNIREAIRKNLELIEHDIYNIDLSNRNILYRNNDVQLVDLDGQYIGYNASLLEEEYFYFINAILRIISTKLREQYGEYSMQIMEELLHFYRYETVLTKDLPFQIVDKVEKMKVLKR